MSTLVNQQTGKAGSRLAPVFVGLMASSAAAMVIESARANHEWHRWEFLGLAIVAAVTSRLKVKLPGINGNMSVNLPFIFIALAKLNMTEALVVAGTAVFIQSIPQAPHKFVPVQALFNLSTALVAAGLASYALRFGSASHLNPEASLVFGCGTHLLVSTVAVAMIICLADNRPGMQTWSDILHLSFPYYLASAGLASIASGFGAHTTWPMLVGSGLVMYVTYRSYRLYFANMREQHVPIASVKAVAAGQ